jgi:hypothetical protein
MTDYEVSRSAVLPCDIGRAHALLDDFHEWPAWSPWEELDPDMSRTYSGAESGVGARYAADGTLMWTHAGSAGGVMGLMAKVYPMEKAIAPDMEKGLANLMTLAARPAETA